MKSLQNCKIKIDPLRFVRTCPYPMNHIEPVMLFPLNKKARLLYHPHHISVNVTTYHAVEHRIDEVLQWSDDGARTPAMLHEENLSTRLAPPIQ